MNCLAISLTSIILQEDKSFATKDYSTTINNFVKVNNISKIIWLSIHQAATLRFYQEKPHSMVCKIISIITIAHGLQ